MSQDSQNTLYVPLHLSADNAQTLIEMDKAHRENQLKEIQSPEEKITEEAAFESLSILATLLSSPKDLGFEFKATQITENLDPIVSAILEKADISSPFDLARVEPVWNPNENLSLPPTQSIKDIYTCLKQHSLLIPKTFEKCQSLWPNPQE